MPITRSIILLFVAEFLFYVSGYVVHLGAGRILGPEDYGRYGLIITVTLLVANLIGNGVPIAMSKFLSEYSMKDPGRLQAVRRTGIALQAVIMGSVTVLFYSASGLMAAALGDDSLAPLFRLSSLIIPFFAADSFYFYFYSGIQRFDVQSGLKIARSILRMTVILALAYVFSVEGIVAGYILVPLSVFLGAWAMDVFTPVGRLPGASGAGFPWAKMVRMSLPITLILVLFEILMSLDLYLVKALTGDDVLSGQYNAALTIARIPTFLFYALTLILLPTISESFSTLDRKRAKAIIENAMRFMLVLAVPFVVLIAAYARSVVEVLFGDGFGPAADLLIPLAAGSILLAILYVFSFAYGGAGKVRIPIIFLGSAVVANAALDVLLYPIMGVGIFPFVKLAIAAAIIPPLFLSLSGTFDARLGRKVSRKVLLAAVPVALIAFAAGDTVPSLFFGSTASLVVYMTLLYRFGVIAPSDIAFLRRRPVSDSRTGTSKSVA